MEKIDSLFLNMGKLNWKVFFISLGLVFAMTMLPKMGFKTHVSIVSPVKPDVMDSIDGFSIESGISLVSTADAASDYDKAKAYGVIDFDSGQVLAGKNLSDQLPIASLTKLMSAVITLDLLNPEDLITIPIKATLTEPTNMGLIPGQKWNVGELLTSVLLTSANDSTETLKNAIDQKYGASVFIASMNAKAEKLGLKNTHFENPQGFDGKYHYSSVEDFMLLTHYALKNYPLILETVKKDYQFYPATGNHKQADLYNWNGLLGVYPGAMGVKIGNTDSAGYTTAVLSAREGRRVLAVVLGAPDVLHRDLWASKLLDLGFAKFGINPANITEDQLKAKYAIWKQTW